MSCSPQSSPISRPTTPPPAALCASPSTLASISPHRNLPSVTSYSPLSHRVNNNHTICTPSPSNHPVSLGLSNTQLTASPDMGLHSSTIPLTLPTTPQKVQTPYQNQFVPARSRSITAAQQRAQLRLGIPQTPKAGLNHCDALLDPAGHFARLLYTQSYASPIVDTASSPALGPMGYDILTTKSFSSPVRVSSTSPLSFRSQYSRGVPGYSLTQRLSTDPVTLLDVPQHISKRIHLANSVSRSNSPSISCAGNESSFAHAHTDATGICSPVRRKLPGCKYETDESDLGVAIGKSVSLRCESPPLIHKDTIAMMQRAKAAKDARQRRITELPIEPYKILDAPGIVDDFYLNILDWSVRNVISVALGSTVYLWDATTSGVTALADLSTTGSSIARELDINSSQADVVVSSVKWNGAGNLLAVGTDLGTVQLWDVARQSVVREFGTGHHSQRVGVLAWSQDQLVTGSKDYQILQWDHRVPNRPVMALNDHRGEVTAIEWSHDSALVATGGNDNRLLVWDPRKISHRVALTLGQQQPRSQPLHVMTDHSAAVRAVAWSPHQSGMLVSGGGTNDKTIRRWQIYGPAPTKATHVAHVGSQVCTVAWSPTAAHELVTTHGFACMDLPPLAHANAIAVWDARSLTPLANLVGHSARVLYAAMSPDGSALCTGAGAGDETLRLWKMFPALPDKIDHSFNLNRSESPLKSSIWSSNSRFR